MLTDWLDVLTNGLWIGGLAGILATFSYYDYIASHRGKPRRSVLNSPLAVFYFSLSATAFCLGCALSGGGWPVRVAWGVLAMVFAWQAKPPVSVGSA
jgi:hypothetical protein